MLRRLQSSSPENFSAATAGNSIAAAMSVLERQRVMLQRAYHDQLHHHHNQPSPAADTKGNGIALLRYQSLMNSMNIHQLIDEKSPNFGFRACSEITSNNTSIDLDQQQHTVSATNSSTDHTKKRKAEFDAERMECKGKMYEEAGEVQSELTVKSEKENSGKTSKENSKASEKTDFIHVRARRGQATDSHSLAERARREKISKKMKCLQELVPGCDKVTGKAGMLDEIINYVQSLQKQVEFLSMKLAALNPRLDINMDNFFAKELPAYMAGCSTPLELMQSAYQQYNQGPDPQGSSSCSVDTSTTPNQMVPQRNGTSSLSFPEAYLDSYSSLAQVQQMSTWDNDWQNLYNVSLQ